MVHLSLGSLLVPLSLACAVQKSAPQDRSAVPMVRLRPPKGKSVEVKVEIARTEPERSKGLMYRDRLPEGTGMLFLFDEESAQTFWMKNTYLSLDMIFLSKDRRVVGVIERAEPLTLKPRTVPAASQFVLEVPAGFARAHDIVPGTQAEFIHVE